MEDQLLPELPTVCSTSKGFHLNDRPIIGKFVENISEGTSQLEQEIAQKESLL
jgi:hypothetical protein